MDSGLKRKSDQAATGVQKSSRSEFLLALAAVGSGAVVARGASPQGAANSVKPRLIDVHHHIFPPDYIKTFDAYNPQAGTMMSGWPWTAQKSLAEMDANGVATAITSITPPGTWVGEVQASRSLTRKCNEYSAQLGRDYAGRFGFFAALPLPDTEGSLQEIGYALDTLKANGFSLMTNYGDKYLGDPAFAPLLEELNRRKAVVHVHPMGGAKNVVRGVPNAWVELPLETTRAVLSLLTSGSFVRLRDIRFIFSHAGGTIPMLAGRISETTRFVDDLAAKAPNGFEYELKRLHYDIAVSANPSAMAALMNLVPVSQIVFGSDYPIMPIAATAGKMTKNLGHSNADLQAIGHENALALFPAVRTETRTQSTRKLK